MLEFVYHYKVLRDEELARLKLALASKSSSIEILFMHYKYR